MATVNGTISLNAGTITNQMISTAATDILQASKLQHCYKHGTDFGTVIGGSPATAEKIVYVATNAGTVVTFGALLNVTGSNTNIAFDLKKNGTSVLASAVTITNVNTNRQVSDGTITNTSFVDEDVFSMVMTVTTNTNAAGPYATAAFVENTSPQ